MKSKASGFFALAYPSSDPASPVLLSFIFKHSEKSAQATLSLVQSSLFLKGFDVAQTFVLQYDADNIVPGSASLGPAAIPLRQDRLDKIVHSNTPQIQTLSFKLKKCCPIWGPQHASTVPKPGSEALFTQLGDLARATELCILFDFKWLHTTTSAVFRRLVQHPEQFSGFPVGRYYETSLWCMHASVFNPLRNDNATADSDATTEDEAKPPSYTNASRKRPRYSTLVLFARAYHKRLTRDKGTTSPASSPPAQGRVPLPPYSEHLATSPNEKGSTVASSPKHPPSPTLAALAPDIQKAVKEAVYGAVAELLPSLEALLPGLLTTRRSPSPSPSPSPSASSKTSTPPLLKLSSLGLLLSEYVAGGVKRELKTIFETTASHAAYLRDVADTEFVEVLDEYRLDVNMAKDDCVNDLGLVAEEKLEEFKANCEAEMETLGANVELKAMTVYEDFEEQTVAMAKRKMDDLREERGQLGFERWWEKKRRLDIQDDPAKGSSVKRGTRAGSAPL
jgi:hypothetical protein